MYTVVRLQTELFIFSQRKSTQWLSALCYVSYTEKREGKERRENTDMHKGTLAAESDLVTVGSSLPRREEWTYDTYHIWQGYSVLGNYQSDVKGGFDSWLIPTGESSASIRGLEKQGHEGQRGKGQIVRQGVLGPDEAGLCYVQITHSVQAHLKYASHIPPFGLFVWHQLQQTSLLVKLNVYIKYTSNCHKQKLEPTYIIIYTRLHFSIQRCKVTACHLFLARNNSTEHF